MGRVLYRCAAQLRNVNGFGSRGEYLPLCSVLVQLPFLLSVSWLHGWVPWEGLSVLCSLSHGSFSKRSARGRL